MTAAGEPKLDPDRVLALSYVPARHRDAIGALWRLDAALGAVLAGGREPLISRIKLAWWREALEKLDREGAPAEPVLEALGRHVVSDAVSGAALAAMEEGWSVLLADEPLSDEELETYAARRGGLLFLYSALLLGAAGGAELEKAGEAWALADLARHSGDPKESERAMEAARARGHDRRWPRALRPLGILYTLARRDCEPGRPVMEAQGAPRRMLRMLRHRLTGN